MEYLDVVDKHDNVTGKASREEIYSKKLNHRIVHVFVINPKTREIYIQKRADSVSYLPGYFCTSAGGHVLSKEGYQEGALRELKEELGLNVQVKRLTKMSFVLDNHERFIELFIAYAEKGFEFKDGEVKNGRFYSLKEANDLIKKGEKIHPQLKFCFDWIYSNRERLFD